MVEQMFPHLISGMLQYSHYSQLYIKQHDLKKGEISFQEFNIKQCFPSKRKEKSKVGNFVLDGHSDSPLVNRLAYSLTNTIPHVWTRAFSGIKFRKGSIL